MEFLKNIRTVNLGLIIIRRTTGKTIFENDFFNRFSGQENKIIKRILVSDDKKPGEREISLNSGHVIGFSKYNIGNDRDLFLMNEISKKKFRRENIKFIENQNRIKCVVREISHEISNPLASVIMTLEVLQTGLNGYTDKEIHQYLKTSLGELERLTSILERLKSSTAEKRIILNKYRIKRVIENVIKPNRSMLDKKSIELKTFIPGSLEAVLDKTAFQQVIFNLIHNSGNILQKRGKIEIVFEKEHIFSGNYIRINYRNNGPELNANERKNIFTTAFSGRENGSGLGMSIAKRLMIRMGGAIMISKPPDGWGVQFSIYLPKGLGRSIFNGNADFTQLASIDENNLYFQESK